MANEFIARNGMISKGNVVVTGSLTTSGSLTTTGTITATTLVVQTITSSISSITGSTNFGSLSSDTHKFTGSLLLSGSATFSSSITMNGTNAQLLQTTANSVAGDNIAVLYNSNANSYGMYIGAGSGTNHSLYCTDYTRTKDLFRVLGNGNVGIGTSSPLDTYGGRTVLTINNNGLYGAFLNFGYNGSLYGFIQQQTDILQIGSQANIPLAFYSNAVERLRLTTAGKVTIPSGANGTSYFSMNYTSSNAGSREWAIGSDTAGWGSFSIGQATTQGGSTFSDKIIISSTGVVTIGSGTFTSANGGLALKGNSGDPYISWHSDSGTRLGYLQMQTSGVTVFDSTQNISISGGNVYINTNVGTTQGEKLFVTATNLAAMFKTTGGATNQWAANFWNNATSGNNLFIEFATETSFLGRGSVTYNRGSGIVVFNTTSDYRIKTEIQDFNALSIIANLKPKEFRIGNAENKAIGFIAHELQEYYPQAVHGEKDEIDSKGNPKYQGVDYSQLTGLLTKAIQELTARVQELENK